MLLIMSFVFPLYTYKKLHKLKRGFWTILFSTVMFIGVLFFLGKYDHKLVLLLAMAVSQAYVILDCCLLIKKN